MNKIFLPVLLAGLVGVFALVSIAQAYRMQYRPGTEVDGDIVLGPTKTELFLEPGDKVTKEITVTNRTGGIVNFGIGIEDFKGSRDLTQSVVLMGEEEGPFPLRDWLKPEVEEFTLKHGQKIHLPIEVSIPLDAEPGGHYGVIFVMTKPAGLETEAEKEAAKGQVTIVSRVGSLFFVRIKGEVEEDGFLRGFSALNSKKFFEKGPIAFELLFENNGSVHLTPYGIIEIKNLLGRRVGEVEIDPWFVLPDALRLREVKWEREFLFGRYTALASMNRGYDDIIDREYFVFWVIPWKIILLGLAGLFSLILFFRWVASHFEIRRKK